MKPLLAAKKITKTFRSPTAMTVLQEIDLTLHEKERVAIVGKSGAGKSSLLHILGTLDEPTSGELFIYDERVTSSTAPKLRRDLLGFLFQSFFLLEEFTVLENALVPAQIAGRDLKEARERAQLLLVRVGLERHFDKPAKHLSVGEKQRLSLVRALLNNPKLLLADEPTGNLDAENGRHVMDLLFDATASEGRALLLVTHDLDLAARCDRVLHLKDGHLS